MPKIENPRAYNEKTRLELELDEQERFRKTMQILRGLPNGITYNFITIGKYKVDIFTHPISSWEDYLDASAMFKGSELERYYMNNEHIAIVHNWTWHSYDIDVVFFVKEYLITLDKISEGRCIVQEKAYKPLPHKTITCSVKGG